MQNKLLKSYVLYYQGFLIGEHVFFFSLRPDWATLSWKKLVDWKNFTVFGLRFVFGGWRSCVKAYQPQKLILYSYYFIIFIYYYSILLFYFLFLFSIFVITCSWSCLHNNKCNDDPNIFTDQRSVSCF